MNGTMAEKKRGRGRPRQNLVPLNVNIPRELREALDRAIAETRRPLTTEVVIALEAHLQRYLQQTENDGQD